MEPRDIWGQSKNLQKVKRNDKKGDRFMKHYLLLGCLFIILSGCASGFHVEKGQKTTNITVNAKLNTPVKRNLEFRIYEYDANKCELASANHVTRISTHGVFGAGAENNVSLPVPTNKPIYVYYKMVTQPIKYNSFSNLGYLGSE